MKKNYPDENTYDELKKKYGYPYFETLTGSNKKISFSPRLNTKASSSLNNFASQLK